MYALRQNGLLTKKGTRAKSTDYFADHTNRAGHDLCFPVQDLLLVRLSFLQYWIS